MKIVLTTHQFVPEFSGGTEILTFETAQQLQRLGHKVSVFTAFPASSVSNHVGTVDEYELAGIHVVRFYHARVAMGNQSDVLELEYNNRSVAAVFKNYVSRDRPDVVHFFHLSRLSASIVDVCHELRLPTVLTPTDFWLICPTSQLRLPNNQPCLGPEGSGLNCVRHLEAIDPGVSVFLGRYPTWLLALLIFFTGLGLPVQKLFPVLTQACLRQDYLLKRMKLIDKVLVPTQTMLWLLTRNGLDRTRTISIPYGINLTHFQNGETKTPGRVLRVGYIGALAHHKGVHVLVEAIRLLDAQPVQLSIYGNPEEFPAYVERLRSIAQGDTRIEFRGSFPNHQIGNVFSTLDVLVVPSLWYENSPLIIYSAQAAKVPVIATRLGGMSDVIQHGKNGLLFDVGNSAQLAANLAKLLQDRNFLDELANNSKQPLSIEGYVDELLSVYRNMVGTGAAP